MTDEEKVGESGEVPGDVEEGPEGDGGDPTAQGGGRRPSRDWVGRLVRALGREVVSTDPAELVLYDRDAAPLPPSTRWVFHPVPDAVVRPRSDEDVRRAVRFAAKHGVAVVPRGGATWGFGGAVPTNGGMVFDLQALRGISVDADTMTVTAGAGAVWRDVMDMAERRGYMLPAYPSSAPGSTVGGWVSTGGVGIGSYKYGGIDRMVRAMRVVLASGELVRLGFDQVLPNSSGYDLKSLIIGSEGTLGVVTEATLELVPAPEALRPVSAGFPGPRELGDFVKLLTRSRLLPYHVSFVDPDHLRNLGAIGAEVPYPGGLVNLSFEGYRAVVDWEVEAASELVRRSGGEVAPEAFSRGRWDERLFDLRAAKEGPTLLMSDVFVPLSRLTEALDGLHRIIERHKVVGGVVGTAASRSTATMMPYLLVDRREWSTFFAYGLVDEFAAIAIDLGGRPAGVGLWGAHQMPQLHGGALQAMAAVKRGLDPKGIMNPGKMLHAVSKFELEVPAAVMGMGTRAITMVHGLIGGDRGSRGKAAAECDARSGRGGDAAGSEGEDGGDRRAAAEAKEAGIRIDGEGAAPGGKRDR